MRNHVELVMRLFIANIFKRYREAVIPYHLELICDWTKLGPGFCLQIPATSALS